MEGTSKVKKPIYKKWWAWLILAFVVFNVVGIITVDTDAEEDKTEAEGTGKLKGKELEDNQKENLRTRMDELVEKSDGIVIDIDFNNDSENGNQMKVVVSDAWYNSEEHEKERFADEIGGQVKALVWGSGLQETGSTLIVDIHDEFDKVVAKNNLVSGKYKIK